MENYSQLLLRNKGLKDGLILLFKHLVNFKNIHFTEHIDVLRDELKN